ncbi:ABC transporter permease [Alsobacter metallidurans]|uniref:ABC transporter permease n=1 Tax=Alsobacter metallidurans TaxID=340221 RepID=A0A917I8K1_9HYPH|nr:ABC transporter substrate-binding protein [Alsobacter metallidurans]GGH24344.1 ABC transporter permease [Alsobacter metallidurans]
MTRTTGRRPTVALAAGALAIFGTLASDALAQAKPLKIGQLSDMSGIVRDLSGPGTNVAMTMAIEDFGGTVLGRPIQLLNGDHLNKPDVGLGMARKWYDEDVTAIFDIGITTVALGMQELSKNKDKLVIYLSTASSDLTGAKCSPNGIHWTYNNYSQALGVVNQLMKQKHDSWYFMTVDYGYGVNVERDTTAMVKKAGGTILGSTKHPFDTTDFSSDLLKSQASGAKVVALATTTAHAANIVKQADEFGIRPKQQLAALSLTLHDTKAMGLKTAQGLLETAPFYWDQNDQTRAFSKRYFDRFGKMPNMIQASAYGAVMHYLNAVKAAGTDDTAAVNKKMRETPINDFMTHNGSIRPDGRVMRQMYVFEVKKPEESKGEWDLYKQVAEIAPEDAFAPADPSVCPLAK